MGRLEKQKRENQSLGRARLLYHRDLAWTFGFPLGLLANNNSGCFEQKSSDRGENRQLSWIRLDSIATTDSQFTIDREVLRRSTMAASKLRTQFPKAICRVFADPSLWFERLDQLLEALKGFLHRGETNQLQVKKLLASVAETAPWNQPGTSCPRRNLPPIVDALRLAEAMCPKPSNLPMDSWLSSASEQLQRVYLDRHGDRNAMTHGLSNRDFEFCLLAELRQELAPRDNLVRFANLMTSPAVRFLHHPDPMHNVSIWSERGRGLLTRQRKKREETLQQPELLPNRTTIRPIVIKLLSHAATQKVKTRQSIVDSVSIFGLENVLKPLEETSIEIWAEERRLRSLVQQLQSAIEFRCKVPKSSAKPMMAELNVRFSKEPIVNSVKAWHSALEFLTDGSMDIGVIREVDRFIAQCDGDFATGLSLISCWKKRSKRKNSKEQRVLNKDWGDFFQALNQVARRALVANVARLIRPPEVLLFGDFDSLIDAVLATTDGYGDRPAKSRTKKVRLNRLIELLEQLLDASVVQLSRPAFDSIPTLIASQLSVDQIREILTRLNKIADDASALGHQDIERIFTFANDVDDFFTLKNSLDGGEFFETELLRPLTVLSADRMGKFLVNRWIKNRNWKRIRVISGLLSLVSLDDDARKEMSCSQAPDWMERYPSPLRGSLIQLNAICNSAEEIARKILSKDFGDHGKRQSEMRFLSEQLAAGELTAHQRDRFRNRLHRLEQFENVAPVISDQRLANLNQKLFDRAIHEYESQLQRTLVDKFCGEFSGDLRTLIEARLQQPEFCMVAVGINKLDKTLRHFGNELLRCSLTNQRFPEMDYAKNCEFIDQIRKAGINAEPWLNLDSAVTMPWNDESSITLSFASEPMDYLLMGHHFQTCLSPSSFNFFSTIANAIDVNKRVIYGRDPDGKVLGRCLIALTNGGRLVRFHAYSHDHGDTFERMIEQFIDQLLVQMKTIRADEPSSAPRLLADDWYDDGAVNENVRSSPQEWAAKLLQSSAEMESPDTVAMEQLKKAFRVVLKGDYPYQIASRIDERVAPWAVDLLREQMWELNQPRMNIVGLASQLFSINRPEACLAVMRDISTKDLIRVFQNSSCRSENCYAFHGFYDINFVQLVIDSVGPSLGLRLLRASRKRKIATDLDEPSTDRRKLLAGCHQKLGREELARKLRVRHSSQ